MIFSVRANWIRHFTYFNSHPMMCFIAEILITRYPIIFNFRNRTGWVLEKNSGWVGFLDPTRDWYQQIISVYSIRKYPINSKPISSLSFVRTKLFFNAIGLTFYFRVSQKSLFIGNQEYFDHTFVHISI